ncbi:leucine-rich repeat and guanylate kinase domain-containing protein [Megalops cyprinoides]|uniref:leucine-rich repeat and guanylate kinase domain-containing protein n=1 Tax=Megalops cyprinoides TaxID=118141 RepID=UPI00186464BB|nr:leucine-rich repeat and guanylate kinase domain-containing protein [Megalops cyprinoides]
MSVTASPRLSHTPLSLDGNPLGYRASAGTPRSPGAPVSPEPESAGVSSASEEEENSMEEDGILTEEEVSSCLHTLGLSATGLEYLYLCLSAPGRNLTDVSILCNYVHLQKLELPYNKIKDLSCVSHMPYLLVLDASHNELSDFFGFQPPKNLQEVNLSYNHMSEMKDLTAYSSLSKLNLDHNSFREIRGLEKCSSLTHLSLSHNRLSRISGLASLPLKELCLRGNQIRKIENMETLWTLQTLDLSSNRIQSLSGLQNLHLLGSINLENNQVSEIKEASHIHDLPLLRELNLQRNPVQDQTDYRLAVVFLLQRLTSLDQQRVAAEEKVSAVNKYDPPPEVVAARDHMMHVVYQLGQPQVIFDSTLPSLDAPYPMLVLTGPQACGKREFAHRLCQEFSDFFAYGTCHTTRSPYFGEVDGCDYHYVTEEVFQDMIHMGKFIQTIQYAGHRYGLSREALEGVARDGLACCVHMELEGVRSLKNTYFEPRYVLLIPTDREEYARRLRRRALYSRAQIDNAVSRIDAYVHVNREHPGYFDNVIPCDNPAEAYKTLSQVVREYLGLEEQRGATAGNTVTGDSQNEERWKDLATGGAVGLHARTTGVAEPTEPSSRTYQSKLQARLTPQKSSAEVASMQRRRQLAREALMGRSPGAYTQLPNRVSLTAPGSMGSPLQQDPPSLSSMIPMTSDGPADPSGDSSSGESRASSGLSLRSSAGAFSLQDTAEGLERGAGPDVEPLDIPGHDLDSLRDNMSSGHTPDAPRPTSPRNALEVRPIASEPVSARPGSNAKPILPPIPSGRKTTEHPSPKPD